MLLVAIIPAALALVLFAATLGLGDRSSHRLTILPPAPSEH
jgi:hypothetical protein